VVCVVCDNVHPVPDDYDRKNYMTPGEVAYLWGVSPETVRRRIRRGQLPALKIPGGGPPRYLIKRTDAALRPTELGGVS
jgi:excisionase family DNA binding protein